MSNVLWKIAQLCQFTPLAPPMQGVGLKIDHERTL